MMKLKYGKKGDLNIPKGYKRLWDWEVVKEYPNNPELKKYLIDDFLIVQTSKGLKMAWLGCDNNYLSINTSYSLISNDAVRGVFKKINKNEMEE